MKISPQLSEQIHTGNISSHKLRYNTFVLIYKVPYRGKACTASHILIQHGVTHLGKI